MKILHISALSNGGAFNGAYRLHKALLRQGVDSTMLVGEKVNEDYSTEVYSFQKKNKKPNLYNRILNKFGIPVLSEHKQKKYLKGKKGVYECISFPFSDYDITESEHYIEADIINLHWISGFLDHKSFFEKCTKPVVITLRDLYHLQGIFHYEIDVINNKNAFGKLDEKYRLLKKEYLKKFKGKVEIVGISEWIKNKSIDSDIFKNLKHSTINNCINDAEFSLNNKSESRKYLNISEGKIVFVFVSNEINNPRKNISLVVDAIPELSYLKNVVIFSIGGGISPKFPLYVEHRHLGKLDKEELNLVYSASDALIFPTKEEALGNIMLEAMLQGTPVIGAHVGGLKDVIKQGFNGMFFKNDSIESFKETLEQFYLSKDSFKHEDIRNYIIENFSEQKVASQYIFIYESLINGSN